MAKQNYNYLTEFISTLQARGKYTFSLEEVTNEFSKEKEVLRKGLSRLALKSRIIRVRKGFYVIVPPEYSSLGILPANLFIDSLMKHLNRKYYVGLLNAAAIYGAGHQQPQIFQVIISAPVMRKIKMKGIEIQFIVKNEFPEFGIEKSKTDTGYINISNPENTALDLITYQKHSGGIVRIIEVLDELADKFDPLNLIESLKNKWPLASLQRFGFICEKYLDKKEYLDPVKELILNSQIYPVKLNVSQQSKAGKIDKTWQVIENVEVGDLI